MGPKDRGGLGKLYSPGMKALLAALLALAVPAAAEEEEKEKSSPIESLAVGLSANLAREANWNSYDWGPTLSLGLLTSREAAPNRLKYELELSYNDGFSRLSGEGYTSETRVRTAEFKYAKLSFLKVAGSDLRERLRLTPYLAGGVQYVDSREETRELDDDGVYETTDLRRESYWAPTAGAGVEFALTPKTSLALDYDQNFEGGNRRIRRLSLELKVSLFGE